MDTVAVPGPVLAILLFLPVAVLYACTVVHFRIVRQMAAEHRAMLRKLDAERRAAYQRARGSWS